MRLPGDNTLVDTDRRALRDWRNYFLSLEPAASLTAAQVTALKALLTVQEEVEADPPSEGSIPYQGPDGATVAEIGTAGQILTVNADATAPEWQDVSGTDVLLASTALSGADYTIDSSIITKAYKRLIITIIGASPSTGGATRKLTAELSGDNGLTWSAAVDISSTSGTSAADAHSIELTIENTAVIDGVRTVKAMAKGPTTGLNFEFYEQTVSTGYINAVRIDITTSFDAGTIMVIGQN